MPRLFWSKAPDLTRDRHVEGVQGLKAPQTRDMQVGTFSSGAGRGEDENLRGGAKKRVNQLIQKSDKTV